MGRERYNHASFGDGAYREAVYLPFAEVTDTAELSGCRFPSAEWFDYSTIRDQCERHADYAIVLGKRSDMNLISARGLLNAFLPLSTAPSSPWSTAMVRS